MCLLDEKVDKMKYYEHILCLCVATLMFTHSRRVDYWAYTVISLSKTFIWLDKCRF